MTHTHTDHLFALAVAMTVSACAGSSAPQTAGISVYLEAVDTGGSRYRLPADAALYIYGTDSTFFDEVDLSGDELVRTISLPPGSFDVDLTSPSTTGTNWPLTRIDPDGTETIVNAELVTPMPTQVVIVENTTVGLVIQFQLPTLGTVTFATGDLDISLAVGPALSSSGTHSVTFETYFGATAADLPMVFTMDGQSYAWTLDLSTTDVWRQTALDEVCASMAVEGYDTGASDGWELLMAEASDNAKFCIRVDELDPSINYMSIRLWRLGVATAPELTPVLTESYLFDVNFTGQLPVSVFDGATLDVNLLTTPTTVTSGQVRNTIFHDAGAFTLLYLGDGTTTFELQLNP